MYAKLSEKYPDELPEIWLEGLEENLGRDADERLLTELKMIAEQNLGMPSIYAVASEMTVSYSLLFIYYGYYLRTSWKIWSKLQLRRRKKKSWKPEDGRRKRLSKSMKVCVLALLVCDFMCPLSSIRF